MHAAAGSFEEDFARYRAQGHIGPAEPAQPRIEVPRLVSWACVDCIDYGQGELPVPLTTEATQDLDLAWREAGQIRWTVMNPGVRRVPLLPHPHTLELRAVLRSRHAGLAAQATAVVERRVQVVHPAPQWRFDAPAVVNRFDDASLTIHARWVAGGHLQLGGLSVAMEAAADGAWKATVASIPSDELGDFPAQLTLERLDGTPEYHELGLTRHARQPVFTVERLADGSVAFCITGARPVAMEVPSRSQAVDLHLTEGVVHHGFLLPTLLNIRVRDDLDQDHCLAVVLDAPQSAWGRLPTMKPLQWMPT